MHDISFLYVFNKHNGRVSRNEMYATVDDRHYSGLTEYMYGITAEPKASTGE